MPTDQKNQLIEEKLDSISRRASEVINGLSESNAWKIVLEDVQAQCNMLNDNWQFVDDDKKMREFRITKMAVLKILNLVQDYKFDLERANQELKAIRNPDKIQKGDVDTDG